MATEANGGGGGVRRRNDGPPEVPEHPLLFPFPKDIWLMIFEQLKDEPKTLMSCMEAFPLFRRLLEPSQFTWMFGEVLPHVSNYLKKEEVLACRQTCRTWNKAVDNYLEEHRQLLPFDPARITMLEPESKDLRYWDYVKCFVFAIRMRKFMEEMSGSPRRNPFISRSVSIIDSSHRGEDSDTFWSTAFMFLHEFGKHIWHLHLGLRLVQNPPGFLLHLLRVTHSCLPNLRKLHLEIDHIEDGEDDNLQAFLRRHPLPKIPSLESLDLVVRVDGPSLTFEHLVELYGNQLKMLGVNQLNINVPTAGLPSLTELQLNLQDLLWPDLDDVAALFSHLNSPLGKLKMAICIHDDDFNFERLFRLISENFGGTLRVLDLDVRPYVGYDQDYPDQVDVDSTARLGTPHLESLHLAGCSFKKLRIDFLLDVASSLQHLKLTDMTGARRGEPEEEEVLDIYDHLLEGDLYESNVWTWMPKLKRFAVDLIDAESEVFRRSYHRATYEFRNS